MEESKKVSESILKEHFDYLYETKIKPLEIDHPGIVKYLEENYVQLCKEFLEEIRSKK